MSLIKHSQKSIIRVCPTILNDVVLNVDQYHKFLPWCSSSRILNQNKTDLEGELTVSFGMYRASYISKVHHTQSAEEEFSIEAKSFDNSTFKTLISRWQIQPFEVHHSQFRYEVEFEFRNPLLQTLSGIFLNEVVKTMTSSFEQRALKLQAKVVVVKQDHNPEDYEKTLARLEFKKLIKHDEIIKVRNMQQLPREMEANQRGRDQRLSDVLMSEYLKQLIFEHNL